MFRRLLLLTLIIFLITAVGCSETKLVPEELVQGKITPDTPKTRLLVGGSGSNLALAGKLANRYMEANPGVEVVIPSSIGSGGGITKTAEGVLNIGMVSRPVNPEEEKYHLTYLPYARTAVVMAVHPGVKVTGLTSEQITAIFSGKIRNWREVGGGDQPIRILIREKNDSSRLIFNKYIRGFEQVKEPSDAIFLRTDQAMNEAVQSVLNSIGWTDLGMIKTERLNVRPINIDGMVPTADTVQNGRYPLIKELAFVVKGPPEGEVKKFIDFIGSWEAKKIIIENGYLPNK